MVNCNPETVSTDYDTSDRLYFEPLTAEDVLEILHVEQSKGELVGVIVQFGGQTPLKLAQALEEAGIPILGTSPDAIDLAEDRERFAALVNRLGLRSEEHTSELQTLMRISYAVFCLKKKKYKHQLISVTNIQANHNNTVTSIKHLQWPLNSPTGQSSNTHQLYE